MNELILAKFVVVNADYDRDCDYCDNRANLIIKGGVSCCTCGNEIAVCRSCQKELLKELL